MKKTIFILVLYVSSLLNVKNCLASLDPIKVSFSFTQNNELINISGPMHNSMNIKKLFSLINDTDYLIEEIDEPLIYRYPYDLSYSETNASWDSIIAVTGFYEEIILKMAWFPDGKKLAVVGTEKDDDVVGRIYDFSANGSALYNDNLYTMTWGTNDNLYAVAIHPDGKNFAIGGDRTPGSDRATFRLLYLDETNTSTIILANFDTGNTVRALDWSPDGKYLAVAGNGSSNIHVHVYKFKDGSLTELPRCQANYGNTIYSIKWHPTGNYIAVGGANSSSIDTRVAHFHNESLNELIGCRIDGASSTVRTVNWSPDGRYLAVGHSGTNQNPNIYEFKNNMQLIPYSTGPRSLSNLRYLSYSPDGAYLAYGRSNSPLVEVYTSYEDGSSLSDIAGLGYSPSSSVRHLVWDPGGNFLAIADNNSEIVVLKLNENSVHLSKRIKKELLAMYQPSHVMQNRIQNVLKPLSVSNSHALKAYVDEKPESHTKTCTAELITEFAASIHWSKSNNFVVATQFSYPQVTVYQKNGDLLIQKPLATLDTGISPDSAVFSPNEKLLAISSLDGATTKIYSFNDYSLVEQLSTATGANQLAWFSDNATLLLNGGVYEYTGTALVPIDETFRANADIDSSSEYIAYTTSPNFLNIARLGSSGVESVTSMPVSDLPGISMLAWQNPKTIFIAHPSSGIDYFAALHFDGSSLTLMGTGGFSSSPDFFRNIEGIAVDSQGDFGALSITFFSIAPTTHAIYEYDLTSTNGPIILQKTFTHGSSTTFKPQKIKYSSDDEYLLISNSFELEALSLYKRNFNSPPLFSLDETFTVIKGTSDLLNNRVDDILNIETSNAIVTHDDLSIDNSNVLVTIDPLIKDNSNAIAGLLVATSNALDNFSIPNSQAIVTIRNLILNNSFAIISKSELVKETSHAIVTYQPLIIENSNAIDGLLVDTSNAVAGLLVATSDAVAGLLVATSDTAVTNATNLLGLDTIDHGSANIHFNSASITMTYNLNISSDHQLFIHTSGVINGNGHSIQFPSGSSTALTVDSGITTTLEDIILTDYNDDSVSLGAGASLIFGDNCRVE
ncbi:WD40 repeat domain-containing protein, partial [Candidatus Babeliales bacterium]|nr:WD40 repeat domain-containing protein [Candidatus Babeliales bacterium]